MYWKKKTTLDVMIMHCRSWKAAKRHCSDIKEGQEMLAALHRPQQAKTWMNCLGCGGPWHKGGHQNCLAYNQIYTSCHKVGHFLRMCCSKPTQRSSRQPQPLANAVQTYPQQNTQEQISLHTVSQARTEPVPTIKVYMSYLTSMKEITM